MFGVVLQAGGVELGEGEQVYHWLPRVHSRLKPHVLRRVKHAVRRTRHEICRHLYVINRKFLSDDAS
jgi:hypothetical protein